MSKQFVLFILTCLQAIGSWSQTPTKLIWGHNHYCTDNGMIDATNAVQRGFTDKWNNAYFLIPVNKSLQMHQFKFSSSLNQVAVFVKYDSLGKYIWHTTIKSALSQSSLNFGFNSGVQLFNGTTCYSGTATDFIKVGNDSIASSGRFDFLFGIDQNGKTVFLYKNLTVQRLYSGYGNKLLVFSHIPTAIGNWNGVNFNKSDASYLTILDTIGNVLENIYLGHVKENLSQVVLSKSNNILMAFNIRYFTPLRFFDSVFIRADTLHNKSMNTCDGMLLCLDNARKIRWYKRVDSLTDGYSQYLGSIGLVGDSFLYWQFPYDHSTNIFGSKVIMKFKGGNPSFVCLLNERTGTILSKEYVDSVNGGGSNSAGFVNTPDGKRVNVIKFWSDAKRWPGLPDSLKNMNTGLLYSIDQNKNYSRFYAPIAPYSNNGHNPFIYTHQYNMNTTQSEYYVGGYAFKNNGGRNTFVGLFGPKEWPDVLKANYPTNLNVSMYPNPGNGTVYFDIDNTNKLQYSVSDISGKIIESGTLCQNLLNIAQYPAGLYLIQLKSGNRSVVFKYQKID